jgi:hypothetical protein
VPTMANISLQSGSEAISYHFTICLRNLIFFHLFAECVGKCELHMISVHA